MNSRSLPHAVLIAGATLLFSAAAEARFLQPDPLGYVASNNLYAYTSNDPLNETDPSGLQAIPPEAMAHILISHGIDTLRTRPGNSVFNLEYSNPANLQQLSNDVFSSPLAPPVPFYGGLMALQGQVVLQNQNTGQTVPYIIGTDVNGAPTNQVQIRYDPTTGNVVTMFPVPAVVPQSSTTTPLAPIVPMNTPGSSGLIGASVGNGGAIVGQQGPTSTSSSAK